MSAKTKKEELIAVNPAKIKQAQKLIGAETPEETIERALDVLIAEHERNRIAQTANEKFLKSRIQIRDVYGKLDGA
jgi:hypothetical protein